ncbi:MULTISPECIES: outer membrane protein [Legionella]|uniref:outer membrane protein n=1 Tax=Legionella TaxID=445 RepID=UPI000F8DAA64|nr:MULTISPECIES: outer membrane beta-barrel protein [Legionella]MCP0914735.1 porin family protein [Legionella sp. 27cVA30]RUR02809.1 porin family protein [Legionella septentrionalis]RUR11407.1 porin family protein [Legionella septentrionalis]
MHKKIQFILFAASSLLPLSALHAGWYAGVNLGANFVKIEKDLIYPLSGATPTTASFRSAYNNFHGQLLAGYDVHIKDKYSLALEGNVDWFTGNSKFIIDNWFLTTDARAEEKLKTGWGLFLLPQYHYQDNIRFFIGPGISQAKFAVNSGSTAGNVGVTGDFNKWLTGWGLKTGTGIHIHPKTELVLTYQYTNYNTAQWANMEPLSAESLSARYKPIVNTVMVGLTYTCDAPTLDNK